MTKDQTYKIQPAFKILIAIGIVLVATGMAYEAWKDQQALDHLKATPPRADLVIVRDATYQPRNKGAAAIPPVGWSVERFKEHCTSVVADLKRREIDPRVLEQAKREYRIDCTGYQSLGATGRPQ